MNYVRDYGETNFITGMRAWAAMGVVLIHSGGAGLREFGKVGNAVVDFGSAGVAAFFVIAGFSICSSFSKSSGYFDYLVRRLLRILPVYYLYIVVIGVVTGASWHNLVLHLLLVSWVDVTIANSVLGVEWTIPVEVFWYVLLPSMFAFAQKGPTRLAALLVAALFSYYMVNTSFNAAGLSYLSLHWSPFRYAFLFSLGIAAFLIRMWIATSYLVSNTALFFSVALIGSHILKPVTDPYLVAGIATAAMVAFGNGGAPVIKAMFLTPVARFIGTVSYSLYLAHYPILNILGHWIEPQSFMIFLVGTCVSLVVAKLSYDYIELPSNALGRRATSG